MYTLNKNLPVIEKNCRKSCLLLGSLLLAGPSVLEFRCSKSPADMNVQVANFQRCECMQKKDEERQAEEITEESEKFMTLK